MNQLNKKRLLVTLMALIFVILTGCTGVKEVAVDPVTPKAKTEDLSLYIVEEAKKEVKTVPNDPNLQYLDTAYFSKLMEGVPAVSTTRKNYSQAPAEWNFVLVDARPANVYAEGHINGSINIPDSEFDKYKSLLPAKKDTLIIVYCGGLECPLSNNVAKKAKALGYTNVKVYQEGTPAWKQAGNYLVVSAEYVKGQILETNVVRPDKKPVMIIDARPYSMYFDEHIPNAIHMDDTIFVEKYLSAAPTNKETEIIVYCGGFSCGKSHTVADRLVANGYTNVKVFAGGVPSWKEAGLPTFGMKGVKTNFNVAEGKVDRGLTPTEFSQKITGANTVVLDVRTDEERSHGAIKGSIHIPDSVILKDPKAIADKLPKDKNVTILIHCASGVRAAGVVDKVADLGYTNTFYLNNAIHINADGAYTF